jgi:hypothetical protein
MIGPESVDQLLQVLERIANALEQGNVILGRFAECGTVTIESNQLIDTTKPLRSEEII